ncbi:MAG: MBL fold metallo-hydrolase [Candidatus Bathyarchaeia archaeon]
MVELLDGIHAIKIADADGLDTEVYLIECEGGLILIDVGFTQQCLNSIYSGLEDVGKNWEDIKLILITHPHGDHIDNLPEVLSKTGAEIMIGAEDIDELEEKTGIRADIGLRTGDTIGACGGVIAIEVPGHSKGNLSFLLPAYETLIAGDTLVGDEEGNLLPPPEKYCEDADEALKNISVLLDYSFNKMLLTHGKNIMDDARSRVKKLVEASS